MTRTTVRNTHDVAPGITRTIVRNTHGVARGIKIQYDRLHPTILDISHHNREWLVWLFLDTGEQSLPFGVVILKGFSSSVPPLLVSVVLLTSLGQPLRADLIGAQPSTRPSIAPRPSPPGTGVSGPSAATSAVFLQLLGQLQTSVHTTALPHRPAWRPRKYGSATARTAMGSLVGTTCP